MRASFCWNTLSEVLTRWTVKHSDMPLELVCETECERRIRTPILRLLDPAHVSSASRVCIAPSVARQATAVLSSSSYLDAALHMHRCGWSLVPMWHNGKTPAVRWKEFQTTRATESMIRDWFGGGDPYGIAVVFGEVSGWLSSRDFDDLAVYEQWAASFPELAKSLPTVRTHRGRHVYFRATEQSVSRLRRSIGKDGMCGAIHRPDGELRVGHGCYSVVPPSPHPKGGVYEWICGDPGSIPVLDDIAAAGLY